ncbi:MFS general substrate transporter [Nemania sp. FL0916]|nr:MFS general substrate transporter [Nemania sp. FL0916]
MSPELESFLKPVHIDVTTAHVLTHELYLTFQQLAAESSAQFLPTPISESILRPTGGRERGRGGTNLRVGFIELLGSESAPIQNISAVNGNHAHHRTASNLRRVLEKSWPIQETLKNENPDSLFAWIGNCISEVVEEGVEAFHLDRDCELPMGVTFSFPVVQNTLSEATIMAMGKGFAITSKLDLGSLLVNGYEKSKPSGLPPIKVIAILNDAVATLVSFIYQFQEDPTHKAAMGFICGTGTNATIPLRRSILGSEKLPAEIGLGAGDEVQDVRVAVNTEWSINGSAQPLRKLGLISKWDIQLDAEGEVPGFQPLEYMTSGRYLGELGRLMFLDYVKTHLGLSEENLPGQLLRRFGLTTTFLSHFKPPHPPTLLSKLEVEFPPATAQLPVEWTEESAMALYHIAKAIEVRAAALIAAAIIALLACADDIQFLGSPASRTNGPATNGTTDKMNLVIGYTGGCIVHFQEYLSDCQTFMDSIMQAEFGDHSPVRLSLSPCHDGGITGAGVLYGSIHCVARVGPTIKWDKVMPHHRDGEPDESTALLQPGKHGNADEAGAEQNAASPAYSRYGASDMPAALAPGPLEPAPKRDGDVEEALGATSPTNTNTNTSINSSTRSDASSNTDTETSPVAGADTSDPSNFLVNSNPAQFRIAFAGIMLTYFIANFDGTIMASSHPVITSHFGASNSASWLTTAFLLTSTAFSPLVGRLSDAVGRKPLYLATMAVFAAATLWCALAGSMGGFIAARAVCGLGAGGMMTLGSIAVGDLVPIRQRGFYQSIINVVYGLAAASGAAFGGLLADTLGWRWEFGVQLAPLALCLASAVYGMPADLGKHPERGERQTLVQALRNFDFRGSVLLTLSTTFLILGLNLGGNVLPWSHPFIIASLAIFAVCFPTCLYVESRVERPVMPLALLHSSPRANIIFSNCIASFLLNAILFNAPLFFRAVLLKSATESGLFLIVPVITASATGTLTGILISRTGHLKWPLVLGTTFFLLGTAFLSSMTPSWPTWACLIALVPAAAGQGLQFPGTLLAVLAASTQRDQAVVTSTLQLWRALGNVLGVAGSSLVFQNALLKYLVAYVTVPNSGGDGGGLDGEEWKKAFVERVRSSIEAVAALPDGQTKDQVIMSYAAACRATFLVCTGIALVSVLLVLPVRLPRLGKK